MTTLSHPQQAVGPAFSLASMQYARDKTMEAVQRIAALMRPGMTKLQAKEAARQELEAMGMERIWHGSIIRFGASTLKTFSEKIDPEHTLQADDIFFVDLGVVWNGHEGDAGDSFVLGDDPAKQACAAAARQLWQEVAAAWRSKGLSGEALYRFAEQRAGELGWRLNLDIKGHRVSDFPHAIYKAGSLGDFAACPDTGLWILEIQIVEPQGRYGAFYEDLLIREDAAQ
ncbi:M24 family metallopeptidase [uncultured Aquitalea sp.]|uniref:M24 family metallopeptidase n=1 Tax=uncultured Aquitalea sp. TaxID=540272 RepID=UPI0025F80157|nr:M24 family metallopeptidase [uncultured Aquitalea sp.]